MKFSSGSISHGWLGSWLALLVVAFLAACGTISPRRIVTNNPSPTPTPTISPTPTPTATPTATPMAAEVPSQFLFTADPGARMVLGFKINSDGGLSPVPGSPFAMADSPRLLAANGNHLFVAAGSTLTAFAVDKETGAISQADALAVPAVTDLAAEPASSTILVGAATGQFAVHIVNNKIQVVPAARTTATDSSLEPVRSRPGQITDASGRFLYVLNSKEGTISAFRVEAGKLIPLSPPDYPAGHGASSLAIAGP